MPQSINIISLADYVHSSVIFIITVLPAVPTLIAPSYMDRLALKARPLPRLFPILRLQDGIRSRASSVCFMHF